MFKKLSILSYGIFLLSGSLETLPILDRLPVTYISLLLPAFFVFIHIFKYRTYPKLWIFFLTLVSVLGFLLVINLTLNNFDQLKLIRLLTISIVCIIPPFYLFRSKYDVHYFFNVLLVISFIISLVSLFNFNSVLSDGRLNINESNPIWLARTISIGIVWLLVLVVNKRIKPIYFAFLFLPMTISLVLTGSKAPLLAIIISLLVLTIIKLTKIKLSNLKISVFFFALIFLIPTIFFSWNILPENTKLRLSFFRFEDSARENLYNLSLNIMSDNFWGIGLGNFSEYSMFTYPHNLILESFVEIGWIFDDFHTNNNVRNSLYESAQINHSHRVAPNIRYIFY